MSYYYEKISENNGLPAKFMLSQCTDLTIPAHWHDYLEVLYMMEGELTAVVQAGSLSAHPGQSDDHQQQRTPYDPCQWLCLLYSAADFR